MMEIRCGGNSLKSPLDNWKVRLYFLLDMLVALCEFYVQRSLFGCALEQVLKELLYSHLAYPWSPWTVVQCCVFNAITKDLLLLFIIL